MGGETRRAKSLRIGVHHADAVVWGPVYRTHIRDLFSVTAQPRRLPAAAATVSSSSSSSSSLLLLLLLLLLRHRRGLLPRERPRLAHRGGVDPSKERVVKPHGVARALEKRGHARVQLRLRDLLLQERAQGGPVRLRVRASELWKRGGGGGGSERVSGEGGRTVEEGSDDRGRRRRRDGRGDAPRGAVASRPRGPPSRRFRTRARARARRPRP